MTSKCIQCGKQAEVSESTKQLCKQCYLDSYNNVLGFKKFTLVVCTNCGSYSYGKKFRSALPRDSNFIKTIRKSIFENTKFDEKPDIFKINVDFSDPKNKDVAEKIKNNKHGTKANVITQLYVATTLGSGKDSLLKEEKYDLPLKVTFTICDNCSRGKTNYFEGRIQLRNKKNNQFEKAVDYIRSEIKKAKTVFISKEDEIKTGIDFYSTSQKFIQPLGQQLQKKFGGELKITSTLHTRDTQTSKNLYRVDVLLRLTEFNVGDILKINNKLVLVKAISGKKVVGVDLTKNNKNATENYTNKEYETVATTENYKEVNVVKRKPQLEVLNPEDYQAVKVENIEGLKEYEKDLENKKAKNDLINVVVIDEKVYAV
ncbi:hypothetical protein HOC35_01745 [Candidatus Woesearchaeota archaeon]|jgi:nonsense-mediated mRNA decay protein 3|nr:hypothetical protein [Candidatus Woesearchaeota archaeon]